MKWIRVVKLGLLSLIGWQNKQFFVLNRVRVWRVRRLLSHPLSPPPPLPEDFIRYAWEAAVELLSKHITVAINDNGVLKYTFRWSLSNYFASKTFNKLCGVIIFSSSRMTLLWRRLAASCLLVGNYLNSWRNKLECVSLQKIPKTDYWYKWSTTGVDPKPDTLDAWSEAFLYYGSKKSEYSRR